MQQIQEAEALCAKAYKQVSHSWEALMDGIDLQQITEKLRGVDFGLTSLQNSLKILSTV